MRRTMAGELALDSLQRRMRAMHSLYDDAVATMDIDQVNHFEREGVLPIAFSLFHIVNMMDASFMLMTGTPPLWDDRWEARVRPAIADHGKHRTVDEMVHQRIGDYASFRDYMGLVFARTEEWLDDPGSRRTGADRHRPPVPAPGGEYLQCPGGRTRRDHPARCGRVLDLPARSPSHGRDRAGPGPGGPGRHDVLKGVPDQPGAPSASRWRSPPGSASPISGPPARCWSTTSPTADAAEAWPDRVRTKWALSRE